MNKVETALAQATQTKELIIGEGALKNVTHVFNRFFKDKIAIIIADTNTYEAAGKEVQREFESAGISVEKPFIFTDSALYAEYGYMEQVERILSNNEDLIGVAVGSGTLNDLTKLASHHTNRRYMCVATAASMDGYTAYGASITYKGAKQTFNCPAPLAVVADINIIKKAPCNATASGYADLFAKVTAGADWILADVLNVEPINTAAWDIVQGGLKTALEDPQGAHLGHPDAITKLIEGLMLGGFAMQALGSSRVASGAEHQFSHLWDMEHHKYLGKSPSHGFKVAIGMLAVTAFYEQLLKLPMEQLDVDACCKQWKSKEDILHKAHDTFEHTDFPTIGVTECEAKYVTKDELRIRLNAVKANWETIKSRLEHQLIPFKEVRERLMTVGAPTEPEQIGISRSRLKEAFIKAQMIRRRYTVLDFAQQAQLTDQLFDGIFGKGGIWEID